MSVLKEFKAFAMRGNVIDLAVAVVIGAAFGKVVSTLVDGIIMPLLGLATSGVDFSQLKIVLKQATAMQPEVAVKYGLFTQSIIDFLVVAFSIFMVIRVMNRISRKPETIAPPPNAP